MSGGIERSLEELYRSDPDRADAMVFGRRAAVSRRGFLNGAGLAGMGAAVGGFIPFSMFMPAGLVPAAFAQAPASSGAGTPSQQGGPQPQLSRQGSGACGSRRSPAGRRNAREAS